jgi:hypothetical protein
MTNPDSRQQSTEDERRGAFEQAQHDNYRFAEYDHRKVNTMSTALKSALSAVQVASDDPGQQLVAAKVRGLMRGYDARWRDAGYVPVAVEQTVIADLVNIETERKSRSFFIAGKLDVVCEYQGRRVLIDHKTTSNDIADPNAPYWRQLVIEGQASHYLLLEWLNGRKIDTAVWDCLKKPSIRPKKLTKAERAAVVASRKYFGEKLDDSELERLQTDETESLVMYEHRLAHDCTVERPEYYFQRRGVPRLDSEIHEYAKELWAHSQDMLHANREEYHPRNSGACFTYGTACQFLGVCSGHESIESDKWQRKSQVHTELNLDGTDGRDVLTNSRIRCFQTCRRKEFYLYQLGVQQVDEEERENLFFGSLWHVAQQAWWESQMKGDSNVNSDTNGCEASGVSQPIAASVENDAW